MKESDVDTSIFQTRSCRMVSTSKASQNGLSIENIMEMADWSNQGHSINSISELK
jgi:hypothetical protein